MSITPQRFACFEVLSRCLSFKRAISHCVAVQRIFAILSAAYFAILPHAFADAADNDLLTGWLNAQTNIQTWEADFVQTRSLKSLTQPLTASGHVWFAAPNRFRWEITSPSQTIAVRQASQMLVLYPKLKRGERYALDNDKAREWKDTLALLDAGFPRSRDQIESRFRIVSQSTSNGVHEIALQPKAEAARRIMPQIKIGFDSQNFALRSTQLQFADGSTMENAFTNAVLNPKIDESEFNPPIEADWKMTEPFKGK
jgi:outer membrane lipoprotein-sorting protein